MQMQITDNGRSNRMLHVNCAQEPYVNEDSFISDTVSQKIIKIPLENPCTGVIAYPTVKSVTNTFILWSEKTKQANK